MRRCLSCSLPGCYGLDCLDAEETAMRRAGFCPDSGADLRVTTARDFLQAECHGTDEEIMASAGAVLVKLEGRVVSVAELTAEIDARHAAGGSGVAELDEARIAMSVLNEAEQLDDVAARALLLYSGYGRLTYAECEEAAREAYLQAVSDCM